MTACTVAFQRIFEALTAVCVVVAVLSLAQGSPWWSMMFAGLALAAFEASTP